MKKIYCKTIKKLVEEQITELIQLRRNIHCEPELGWQEYKTTEKIINFLRSHQIDRISRPLETGVIAEIVYHPDAPFIGIRADIDALPIQDEKTVSYRSRNKGISHSCGHDFHAAVVCGIAAIMKNYGSDLAYNLRFIFQPAEEPIPSGAPRLIEQGVLENVQTVWTWHVEPALSLGTIGLMPGWVNAQSIKLDWEIKGAGGHSARPHLACNPIPATAFLMEKIEKNFQKFREEDKFPAVMTLTKIKSLGDAYNVIPEKVSVGGTLRITDPEKSSLYPEIIHKIVRQTEKRYGVNIHTEILFGSPPVQNDGKIIKRFEKNLTQFNCSEFQIVPHERSMGGDDFGWYSQLIPSALVRFGTAVSGNTPAVHTGLFDAPEEIIQRAVSFFIHQILSW